MIPCQNCWIKIYVCCHTWFGWKSIKLNANLSFKSCNFASQIELIGGGSPAEVATREDADMADEPVDDILKDTSTRLKQVYAVVSGQKKYFV